MAVEYRNADALATAALRLSDGMTWATTPEGHEFWKAVSDRLLLHQRAAKGDPAAAKELTLPWKLPLPKNLLGLAAEAASKDFAAQTRERLKSLTSAKQ